LNEQSPEIPCVRRPQHVARFLFRYGESLTGRHLSRREGHAFQGEDLGGLLLAEWIFHVGSMVAMAIVLAAIVTAATRRDARL